MKAIATSGPLVCCAPSHYFLHFPHWSCCVHGNTTTRRASGRRCAAAQVQLLLGHDYATPCCHLGCVPSKAAGPQLTTQHEIPSATAAAGITFACSAKCLLRLLVRYIVPGMPFVVECVCAVSGLVGKGFRTKANRRTGRIVRQTVRHCLGSQYACDASTVRAYAQHCAGEGAAALLSQHAAGCSPYYVACDVAETCCKASAPGLYICVCSATCVSVVECGVGWVCWVVSVVDWFAAGAAMAA